MRSSHLQVIPTTTLDAVAVAGAIFMRSTEMLRAKAVVGPFPP